VLSTRVKSFKIVCLTFVYSVLCFHVAMPGNAKGQTILFFIHRHVSLIFLVVSKTGKLVHIVLQTWVNDFVIFCFEAMRLDFFQPHPTPI
jgi:hypothetical protein